MAPTPRRCRQRRRGTFRLVHARSLSPGRLFSTTSISLSLHLVTLLQSMLGDAMDHAGCQPSRAAPTPVASDKRDDAQHNRKESDKVDQATVAKEIAAFLESDAVGMSADEAKKSAHAACEPSFLPLPPLFPPFPHLSPTFSKRDPYWLIVPFVASYCSGPRHHIYSAPGPNDEGRRLRRGVHPHDKGTGREAAVRPSQQ
jgi:hypothetical protein